MACGQGSMCGSLLFNPSWDYVQLGLKWGAWSRSAASGHSSGLLPGREALCQSGSSSGLSFLHLSRGLEGLELGQVWLCLVSSPGG